MTYRWLPASLRRPLLNTSAFSPAQVSAVTGWLRFAAGTVTGSGYSSVPDVLASNPATQGTDADRPPNFNSANGLPMADFDGTSDNLSWPAASNNQSSPQGGVAFWVKPDAVVGVLGLVTCTPGVTSRFEIITNGTQLIVNVNHSQFVSRRGAISAVLAANTNTFITWEFDGTQATDALKCTLTVGGVVQTLTFTDDSGAPGAMPTTLVNSAGPLLLGARFSGGLTGFFNGKIGPNVYVLGSKMAGATQGLLTTAARTALMNFEAPT